MRSRGLLRVWKKTFSHYMKTMNTIIDASADMNNIWIE